MSIVGYLGWAGQVSQQPLPWATESASYTGVKSIVNYSGVIMLNVHALHGCVLWVICYGVRLRETAEETSWEK